MLSKLTFGEHATENARKFMRDGAHPSVHDIAFVDAATVVTAGMDGKCRVWDARTGREWEFTHVAGMWDADGTPIMSVTVAPRRGIVAHCGFDGCLRGFDFRRSGHVAVADDVAGAEVCCAFSPDERLVACGLYEGLIRVRVVRKLLDAPGAEENLFEGEEMYSTDEDSESDEDYWSDRPAYCELTTHAGSERYEGSKTGACLSGRALAWIDSATLVTAGRDVTAVWDLDTFKVVELREFNSNFVQPEIAVSPAASPDAPIVAFCSDRGAWLYRLVRDDEGLLACSGGTTEACKTVLHDVNICLSPTFTPDGLNVAFIETSRFQGHTSSSGAAVTLYSVRSGTLEHVIDAHSIVPPSSCHWLSCLAISPDGRRIAVADRDGFAYSWDMVTPKSVLVKMLLLRTRPSPSPVDGFARAAGHTGLRMEPRVTIADEAFAWADSGRANCILFRLVDSGHVDIASYALKFLT